MNKKRFSNGLTGFTLVELLIAMAIVGIFMVAVNTALSTTIRLSRRSYGTSIAQGGGVGVTDVLQEDLNSAHYGPTLAPRGSATSLWFVKQGSDIDGDGNEDGVCYRYFTVAEDTAGQGYLGRVQFPSNIAPFPSSTAPTCAVTPPSSYAYTRLNTPDTSIQDFAFSYCKPSTTLNSHRMTCVASTALLTGRCGGYEPIALWSLGLTFSTARRVYSGGAWAVKEGAAAKSWRTYSFKLRDIYTRGVMDNEQFTACAGASAGTDDPQNGCPDAFDVLGRLCSCNCTPDGLDNDANAVIDEECISGIDSDADGNVGNPATGCE